MGIVYYRMLVIMNEFRNLCQGIPSGINKIKVLMRSIK